MPRLLACLLLALLTGCASSGNPSLSLAPAQYPAAFEAAKDVLAAYRFDLDRVDAGEGVITTKPKATAGLVTPWDTEQSTLDDEVDDLFNQQQRRVRITFEPAQEGPAAPDLRTYVGPVAARVEVVVERTRRPGWRLETTSIRYSTFTQDPALVDRGMWPQYTVPIAQDPELAARLADGIRNRLGQTPAPASPSPASGQ